MSKVTEDKIIDGNFISGFASHKVQYVTKSMSVWRSIKSRCKPDSAFQAGKPSYEGCYLSDNFKDFQYFANWYTSQVGYGLEKYQIDKDIIIRGNKMYGESTCVLVPPAINVFFARKPIKTLPTGVSKQFLRFAASIKIEGVVKYIGNFENVEDAAAAYAEAKEGEAAKWYLKMLSGEVLVDSRVTEVFRSYKYY